MIVKTDSLVLYKNKCAVVTEINADKYTIRTASGEKKSVRLKDIEPLFPGPCKSIPQAAELPDAESLDELLELISGDEMNFADFTELVFGSYNASNAIGAVELLAENCHFQGSVSGMVKANCKEHIEEVRAKANQKQAQIAARAALLERIRSGNVTPGDLPSLREIENVAYADTSSSKLMHDLNMEATPEKAQLLLLKLNVWNEFDNNPHLRRFGFNPAPDYPVLPPLPDEDRVDLTNIPAYAIDDTESNDPDDAIAYDESSNLLWVHIADPAAVIKYDSEVEKFACSQGCTSYLPEKITTMLPENSVDMFALGLQEISNALSFGIEIDSSGNAVLKKLCLSKVKVRRLDYASAGELMQSREFASCIAAVERFRNMRVSNNAVMIRLPEVKIKVNISERQIKITPLDYAPARELVANAMLAAGSATAKFAVEHDIAMPFSIQSDPDITERPETIPGMYELRKNCHVSMLSTVPGKHAGLGLDPYVRVTSPLRRYEDLLSHIQLRRYLAGEELLTSSEIDERIAIAESEEVMRGKLERQCREYWTMVYLKNQPTPWQGEAIYVAKPDDRSVWLIPDLAFEFKNRYNARLALGESVTVECISSDPAALLTQFKVIKNPEE